MASQLGGVRLETNVRTNSQYTKQNNMGIVTTGIAAPQLSQQISPVMRASGRGSFLHRGMNTVMSRSPLSQNQFTASWMPWHENTFLSPWLQTHRKQSWENKQNFFFCVSVHVICTHISSLFFRKCHKACKIKLHKAQRRWVTWHRTETVHVHFVSRRHFLINPEIQECEGLEIKIKRGKNEAPW